MQDKFLTGRYYIKRRLLGGFNIYVEKVYHVGQGSGYSKTRYDWCKAKYQDLIDLKILSQDIRKWHVNRML